MEDGIRHRRVFGRVLLFFVACAVLLASMTPVERQFPGLPPGLLIGAVTSLGTWALTAVFLRWEGLRLGDVGSAIGRKSPIRFAIGFAIGLFLVALHTSIICLAGNVRWVRSEGVGFFDIATVLIIYFLLSCREELAFHGYPLQRLRAPFGLWVSQCIVAIVFAVEHIAGGSTWVQALFGAGVGSLLFGMAAIATKGLALPIGLHAAWNFGDWMRGGKASGGLWHPTARGVSGNRAELVGMVGYVAVMASATVAFWLLYRRSFEEADAA